MDNPERDREGRLTAGCLCVLFTALFIVMGGAMVWIGVHTARDLARTFHAQAFFVPVDATIERVRIDAVKRSGRRGLSTRYEPALVYSFQVNGTSNFGTDVTPYGFDSPNYDDVELFVRNLPPGKTIRAWVDPRDPTRSYMRVDFGLYEFGELLFVVPLQVMAVAIAWVFVWLVASWWRRRGLSEEACFFLDHDIHDSADHLRIRVGDYPSWRWVVVGWCATSLAAAFALAMTFGLRVPFWLVGLIWLVGLVVGALLLRLQRRRTPIDACWFEVDWANGCFKVSGRSESVSEIHDIIVIEALPPFAHRWVLAVQTSGRDPIRFGDVRTNATDLGDLRQFLGERLAGSNRNNDGTANTPSRPSGQPLG